MKYIRDAKIINPIGQEIRLQNHTSILWQPPLLAQPGPANEAIHWALLSLLISSSILIATALLAAASLAEGVINPTLANKHNA